jgi:hypothetical protein
MNGHCVKHQHCTPVCRRNDTYMDTECVAYVYSVARGSAMVLLPHAFKCVPRGRYFVRFTHNALPFFVMRKVRPKMSMSGRVDEIFYW